MLPLFEAEDRDRRADPLAKLFQQADNVGIGVRSVVRKNKFDFTETVEAAKRLGQRRQQVVCLAASVPEGNHDGQHAGPR